MLLLLLHRRAGMLRLAPTTALRRGRTRRSGSSSDVGAGVMMRTAALDRTGRANNDPIVRSFHDKVLVANRGEIACRVRSDSEAFLSTSTSVSGQIA
jgi:hypothetical protein